MLAENRTLARALRIVLEEMGTLTVTASVRLDAILKRTDKALAARDAARLAEMRDDVRRAIADRTRKTRETLDRLHHWDRVLDGGRSSPKRPSPKRPTRSTSRSPSTRSPKRARSATRARGRSASR